VRFLTRVKDQVLGREQPFRWQVLICLMWIVVAGAVGAGITSLQGRPWLDGALSCGGAVLLTTVVGILLPRAIDARAVRRRSRDR
jgi:hypothetical protein